jgi:hypothetical protein
MKNDIFKIYLTLLAISWDCFLIVSVLIEATSLSTQNFIFYMLLGAIFMIFEVFFMASFFVKELENRKVAIIAAFFLSWVYAGVLNAVSDILTAILFKLNV